MAQIPNNWDANAFWSAQPAGAYNSYHSATAGTVVINGIPSLLHSVTINRPIPNGTTILFDCASTAGTSAANIIANIVNFGTVLTEPPLNGIYDVRTKVGLVLVTNGTQDINVSYLP